MRQLRRRPGEDHTTRLQDLNVRCHVTAANNFLDWLGGEGLAIGTCPQTDLERWADARRLLNDDTLPTPDRVAGLLLILYAQKIATISQLTVDDVDFDGDTVSITFGTSPVVLPAPLASLVRELIATRRGKAKIGTPEDAPWLFPGGQPGRPRPVIAITTWCYVPSTLRTPHPDPRQERHGQ